MLVNKHQKGFTLFEALIYIALFTIIIGGSIASAYQIFEGTAQVQGIAERENEVNFVLRKLDWALNGAGAADILEPDSGTPESSRLRVLKDGDVYEFSAADGLLSVVEDPSGSADELVLNNARVEVSSVSFEYIDDDTDSLLMTMVVDGETIGPITKFIR